jgi:DNA-binding transcriptional LysR family regulator
MNDIDGPLVAGLVVLAAIADARSFGKAAERLGMTQSGVSKAVAKLESRLGARLIHRTSRAVELTDEGRALHERVAEHLAGIGEAAAETARTRETVRGRLRVNVDPLFSRVVLPPKLSAFLMQNPHMEIRLETRRPPRRLGERRLRSRRALRPAGAVVADRPPRSRGAYSHRRLADLHRASRQT